MSDSSKVISELKGRMTLTTDKLRYHAEKALFHIERTYALQRTLEGYERALEAINDIVSGKPAEEPQPEPKSEATH